jgi:hypothetical protein
MADLSKLREGDKRRKKRNKERKAWEKSVSAPEREKRRKKLLAEYDEQTKNPKHPAHEYSEARRKNPDLKMSEFLKNKHGKGRVEIK